MTTDPVRDAGDYMDKQLGYAERMAQAEYDLECDFVKACLTKTALDKVNFAISVDRIPGTMEVVRRNAFLFEAMMQTLEGANDDFQAFIMQSLLICAKNGDIDAQSAIRKMAREFAKHNAYVENDR